MLRYEKFFFKKNMGLAFWRVIASAATNLQEEKLCDEIN